jgi:hypothetical protein
MRHEWLAVGAALQAAVSNLLQAGYQRRLFGQALQVSARPDPLIRRRKLSGAMPWMNVGVPLDYNTSAINALPELWRAAAGRRRF